MESTLGAVIAFFAMIFAVWLMYQLFIAIPADMARARGREPFAWVLIAFLGSPFLSIFLLWFLGQAD
ncbi:hypothetical protein [Pseudohalocynthiibacter sp. F2068]|jgi:hypothetical protein|uniref:hypothetical protein n=1 Tax=Pseudohalocynthiibacter sp. F2068 TaxID=2926418 RepID=UPI001FF23416|nr:hypothetical protein [Pseudohalocynthiibacter sp. F2068]MCK0103338.1 hypothetical protein [Pseudohalocynthiibacter sp. F2068]